MKKLSVVIPCYNSEQFLSGTVDKLKAILKDYEYEIILVNDCSKDKTIDVITSIVSQNENVIGIDLAHNTGQHNATMAGFHYVSGDYVITCADDGQSPMERWPEMVEALDEGYDVSTVRFEDRGKRSLFRGFGSWMSKMFGNWLIERPEQGGLLLNLSQKDLL